MTDPRSHTDREAAWVQHWAQRGMAPPLTGMYRAPQPITDQEAERIRWEWRQLYSPGAPPPQARWLPPPTPVVVRPAQKFPHGIHAVLTLLSCGLWLPVYALHYLLHVVHPASKAKVEYH